MSAALAILFVVTRNLFWSAPVLGRLHLRTDDNPLGEISSIVGQLRRWTPREGAQQRIADWLLTVGLALSFSLAAAFPPATTAAIWPAIASVIVYCVFLASIRHRPRRMVLLVIDDLDRCDGERVVRLLETIHTVLRERSTPRWGRTWRTPAPFGVLVLANGAWIRDSFRKHYETFDRSTGPDAVHDLGADFLQKIFDHSVLVPGLSPDQTEDLMHVVAGTKYLAARTRTPRRPHAALAPVIPADTDSSSAGPESIPSTVRAVEEDAMIRPGEPVATPNRPTTPSSAVTTPAPASAQSGDQSEVRARADVRSAETDLGVGSQLLVTHLLTDYHDILPGNPRLIIRVAASWAMLRAVARSLNLEAENEPANELLVRAAVIWVRFPVLVDRLLDADQPPVIDPADEACPAAWRRRDVQQVLTMRDRTRVDIQDLAAYYGKFFAPEVAQPLSTVKPPLQAQLLPHVNDTPAAADDPDQSLARWPGPLADTRPSIGRSSHPEPGSTASVHDGA